MSKRLQVLLPNEEMEAIQRMAKIENLNVGEYVRRTLRDAESLRASKGATAKLVSIREAVNYAFPAADIEDMNREIEQGYRS